MIRTEEENKITATKAVSPYTGDFAPFVVTGASKSGTTWLQKILDTHPQIRCHFQLPIFPLRDSRLFYPGKVVFKKQRSPFAGVFEENDGEAVYRAKLAYINGLKVFDKSYALNITSDMNEAVQEQLRIFHHRVQASIAETLLRDNDEKTFFGTKAYTDLEQLFVVFPKAKIIHIVRDGRDVCVSKRFHNIRKGLYYLGDEKKRLLTAVHSLGPTYRVISHLRRKYGFFGEGWFKILGENGPLFNKESLTKAASDWDRIVKYILAYQERFPEQFATIKYENLLTDGNEQVRRILDFLGANSMDAIIETLLAKTMFSTLKKQGPNSFFREGKSGEWQKYFRNHDLRRFNSIAGETMARLGYES